MTACNSMDAINGWDASYKSDSRDANSIMVACNSRDASNRWDVSNTSDIRNRGGAATYDFKLK
jgi:hypothetical protein